MRSFYFLFFAVLVSSALLIHQMPEQVLEVHFLSVNQGDSTFIRTPSNKKIIIDAGPDSSMLDKLDGMMAPFEHRIDLIVLTHPHRDHIYGFLDLCERYEIGSVLMTGVAYESRDYEYFLDLLSEREIPVHLASSNKDFDFGDGVYLDFLWPRNPSILLKPENLNNDSVVVRLSYGQHRILFTGDAEIEAESELAEQPFDYSSDVLQVGHHGSRTSSTQSFLDMVDPKYAVISAGLENKFNHPHPETLQKLRHVELFRTDLQGDILFRSDGSTFEIGPRH